MSSIDSSGIVTLITDFGLTDPYVGQLKGALLSSSTKVTIVDLTHSIAPHDIPAAAQTLFSSFQFFPAGTVHLTVVDPGVGSTRKILAATGAGHYFIAPDNGIFTILLKQNIIEDVYQITLEPGARSTTFHGRDIMAPVAALLAKGERLSAVGVPIIKDQCTTVALPGFVEQEDHVIAQVIRVDHFGNLRISIKKSDLDRIGAAQSQMRIAISGMEIAGLSATYSSQETGSLCALFDSDGFLEVAINQGSAAEILPAQLGDQVTLWFSR